MWVRAWAASSKGTVSSVPAWFRADSGTNLIKQGEIVAGRLCGSVAQWSECSHGMREVLGSSPGRAMCFECHQTFSGVLVMHSNYRTLTGDKLLKQDQSSFGWSSW